MFFFNIKRISNFRIFLKISDCSTYSPCHPLRFGWTSEGRMAGLLSLLNVHKRREHSILDDLHQRSQDDEQFKYSKLSNHVLFVSFQCLCGTFEYGDVEFCTLINFKIMKLRSGSCTFVYLIPYFLFFLALTFLSLLVVSGISAQLIAKDHCKNCCYSSLILGCS